MGSGAPTIRHKGIAICGIEILRIPTPALLRRVAMGQRATRVASISSIFLTASRGFSNPTKKETHSRRRKPIETGSRASGSCPSAGAAVGWVHASRGRVILSCRLVEVNQSTLHGAIPCTISTSLIKARSNNTAMSGKGPANARGQSGEGA
jgi:hypothetical protein